MTPLAFAFAEPAFLLALLLVPVAVAVYVLQQRKRREYALRFSNLATLASVLPKGPGWRRHVPPALLLAALAALAVALARPETEQTVESETASIVIVTDTSGSMTADDVEPDRITAARAAAYGFLDDVPDSVKVGLVAFNESALSLQAPTTDRDAVRIALASLSPEGGTATGDALETALQALQDPRSPQERPPAAIVLISDGKKTAGGDPVRQARRARRLRIPIYTVALGRKGSTLEVPGIFGTEEVDVSPDPATMRRIARLSRGRYFAGTDTSGLRAAYDQLASRLEDSSETC